MKKKYSEKAINIVNNTWEYLENNFKGSEINMSLLVYTIQKKCDTENCRKQALKYLWENYEWFDLREKEDYILFFKESLGINVK